MQGQSSVATGSAGSKERLGLGIHTGDTNTPSKRGETSRAYSRQRRIFSTLEIDTGLASTQALLPISPHRAGHSQTVQCERKRSQDSVSSWSTRSSGATAADDAASSAATTPSLISPSTGLSRSVSLKTAQVAKAHRSISINTASAMPMRAADTLDLGTDWSNSARRWSSSVSRRVSIAAINQTIHSSTSPFLRAGIQELRSIFDVDTLGLDEDPFADDDIENASPRVSRHRSDAPRILYEERSKLFGSDERQDGLARQLYDSPDMLSPELPGQASRPDDLFDVQASRRSSEAAYTARNGPSLKSSATRATTREETDSRPVIQSAHVAVGLAAVSVSMVLLCAYESTMHPDAASMPLTVFMLAQPAFAILGTISLAMQKRWLMDLSSRLLRAHVLGQILVALAAIRNLSGSAIYEARHSDDLPATLFNSNATLGSHATRVGSLTSQLTYLVVVIVQAAMPLAFAFWAQYAVASSLSRVNRSTNLNKSNSRANSGSVSVERRRSSSSDQRGPSLPSSRQRLNSAERPSPHTAKPRDRVNVESCFHLDAQDLSRRLERILRDTQLPNPNPSFTALQAPAVIVSA